MDRLLSGKKLRKGLRRAGRCIKRVIVGCFMGPDVKVVVDGVRSAGPPRLTAAVAELEAVDVTLHVCGCDCRRCKEGRWRVQQLPRATEFYKFANTCCSTSTSGSTCTLTNSTDNSTSSASCSCAATMSANSLESSSGIASSSRNSHDDTAPPTSGGDFFDVPPLVPWQMPTGAKLLKPITGPDNRTVWLMSLARWPQQQVVVKAVPCHSAEREAEIAAGGGTSFPTPSGTVGGLLSEAEALAEARMAVQVSHAAGPDRFPQRRDVFVQPLHTTVRPCSLAGTQHDAGHDLEVIFVYPYHPDGDARLYMTMVAQVQVERMMDQRCPLDPKDAALAAAVASYEFYRDWLGLLNETHQRGFILNDNKPENIVFNRSAGGYQLIDAESVQRCALGSRIVAGQGQQLALFTPEYAAPEQVARLSADSRSDIYSCGKGMQKVVEECLVHTFREALGGRSAESKAVVMPLMRFLEPLLQLVDKCVEDDPAERPTAAEAYDLIDRFLTGAC